MEINFFNKTYEPIALQLTPDRVLLVKVRVQRDDDEPRFTGLDVSMPDLAIGGSTGPVVIKLPNSRAVPAVIDALKRVLATHPGQTAVMMHLTGDKDENTKVFELQGGFRVTGTPALYADLKALLGPGCLG